MNIKEIYDLKPISVTNELYILDKHVPEIDLNLISDGENEKVEIKTYANYCFDGINTWELKSVWYNSKPVMLIQNAGRDGEAYFYRYITNKDMYIEMVCYLISLQIEESFIDDSESLFTEDYNGKDLTSFYNNSLEEFYNPNFKPKYKKDDIINIDVPKDRRYNTCSRAEMINVPVKVIEVTNIPYNTYKVKEVSRKGNRASYINRKLITIEEYDKLPEEDKKKWEDVYYRLNSKLKIINY